MSRAKWGGNGKPGVKKREKKKNKIFFFAKGGGGCQERGGKKGPSHLTQPKRSGNVSFQEEKGLVRGRNGLGSLE